MAGTCLNMGPSSVACGAHTVGATTVTVRPPKGPQGEGLPMPEPYRPSPRIHVPARLRYSKPAVQLSPKSYFVYLFRWHKAIVKAVIGVIGAHDLGSEGPLKSGGEAQRIQLVRGFAPCVVMEGAHDEDAIAPGVPEPDGVDNAPRVRMRVGHAAACFRAIEVVLHDEILQALRDAIVAAVEDVAKHPGRVDAPRKCQEGERWGERQSAGQFGEGEGQDEKQEGASGEGRAEQ